MSEQTTEELIPVVAPRAAGLALGAARASALRRAPLVAIFAAMMVVGLAPGTAAAASKAKVPGATGNQKKSFVTAPGQTIPPGRALKPGKAVGHGRAVGRTRGPKSVGRKRAAGAPTPAPTVGKRAGGSGQSTAPGAGKRAGGAAAAAPVVQPAAAGAPASPAPPVAPRSSRGRAVAVPRTRRQRAAARALSRRRAARRRAARRQRSLARRAARLGRVAAVAADRLPARPSAQPVTVTPSASPNRTSRPKRERKARPRDASADSGSPVVRTVRDIVEVVPGPLKAALAALATLSLLLLGGYLFAMLRSRRLARRALMRRIVSTSSCLLIV